MLTYLLFLFFFNSFYLKKKKKGKQNPTGLHLLYRAMSQYFEKTPFRKELFSVHSLVPSWLLYSIDRAKNTHGTTSVGKKHCQVQPSPLANGKTEWDLRMIFSVCILHPVLSVLLKITQEQTLTPVKIVHLYLLPCFSFLCSQLQPPWCGIIPYKDLSCSLRPMLFFPLFTPQASLEWNNAL